MSRQAGSQPVPLSSYKVHYFKRNLLLAGMAVLLLAAIAGSILTRDAGVARVDTRQPTKSPINDRLLQTARRAAATADTADQQALAQEALRLADNEYDIAFAAALREAAAAPPTAGPLKKLADRVTAMKARIAAEQESIAKLEKKQATDATDTGLELAKAQLELDQDELAEAQEDLIRQGGDRHATLERIRQEHESVSHNAQAPKPPSPGPTGTLSERIRAWISLRDRHGLLDAARQEAARRATLLGRAHDALEAFNHNQAPPADLTPAWLDHLRHLSNQSKALVDLDKRIQDSQQLADVYKRWDALVEARRAGVLHLILMSLAGIFTVLLVVLALDRAIRYAFVRQQDRRRLYQLRVIATIAVQVIGGLIIAFIIFGLPNQTSTIIGLATAVLTVVLKDFIVAFFGWFVLLGKNGIRIGDWVEIEGVGGEVVEIGLLKTVLLEMGDLTGGQPTGRRVSFNNKFAIENHYFNFSTAGQWLWDELKITLPDVSNAYQMALQIRETVEKETEADGRMAEQEWQRATIQYAKRSVSTRPTVNLRPSASGLEVSVRYITRAPQRSQLKSKLLEAVVDMVHKRGGADLSPRGTSVPQSV